MAIKGSLKEASLPDVLQLLSMGKKSGCLSVNHRQSFGYIYFDKGRICYASIVNRRDRLGDILVKNGLITQAQLDEAVTGQNTQRDTRLGEILVERQFIAREELHRYIRVQIEEAVYYLFTWNQGTFNFEADVAPDAQDFLVSINPESLLLEGARRVDEWSLIEKKIPSFDLVYEVDQARLKESGVELTAEQETLVGLIDGKRDIAGLVDESGLGDFDVGKALYGLVTAGFLHRVGKTKPVEALSTDARVAEHRNLGVAFYKAGMFDEAVREFRRVNELRPGDELATFYAGLVLLRQSRWEDAVTLFQQMIVRRPNSAGVYHNLAYALERLGRYDEAADVLAQALRAGGNDPRTQLAASVLALRRGDIADADAALSEAATLWNRKQKPAAWYHYAALTAALANDIDRAISILSDGIAAHPHSAVLLNNLGVAFERRGRFPDAAMAFDRGTLEDASLPQLHKNLGDGYYRSGRYDEALEAYLRAVKHRPNLGADVYLKLGNLRYRRQEREEANRCWKRALDLEPTNAIARTNLETARAGRMIATGLDDAGFIALTEKIARERSFGCASYKEKCLRRRIAVRMRARGVHRFVDYAALLDRDAVEYERLLDTLTINVTKLFRNWSTFDALARQVVPILWEGATRPIRGWSAGCSSGEEPYSLAILFHQHAAARGESADPSRVQVLASDIDRASLDAARRGQFAEEAFADTPAAIRRRYFSVRPPFEVVPEIRPLVTFERRDLIVEPPPSGMHLIACRNVLIYFDRITQEKLFQRFHDALVPGGFLVLGKVETLLGPTRSLFSAVDPRERIFRRR